MIVEQRTYTLKPGKVADYLALYRTRGLTVQSRHLGQPYGYYSTETGELNQILHMWAYADASDRTARRAVLYADPEWKELLPQLLAMIDKMATVILSPAYFAEPQPCRIVD